MPSALKEDGHSPKEEDRGHSTKEGTSSSDKSGTMASQPTEQRAQALNKGEIDSPSKIRQRNGDADSPQDKGSEPSKPYGGNNGKKACGDAKKDRNLKHHPLAREPPNHRNALTK